MRRRTCHRTAATFLVVVAAVFAGCGGGEDGAPRSEHSSALADTLFRGDERTEAAVDDDARECVAAEFVDAVGGAEELESKGITPEELAAADDLAALGVEVGDAEAESVADALDPCGVPVIDLLLADFGEVPADVRTCVEDEVDQAALRSFVVGAVLGTTGEGDGSGVVDSILVCFPG